MLRLRLSGRRRHVDAESSESWYQQEFRVVEVWSPGSESCRLAFAVSWPSRDDCEAARGGGPVEFQLQFDAFSTELTRILVYVRHCRRISNGSLYVDGVTGSGRLARRLMVFYDFPSLDWAQNIDPDQPRLIAYGRD